MFSKACSIARNFTKPIIISHRTHSGECKAGIGAMVIINEDGWFVTAWHIIQQIKKLQELNQQYKDLMSQREALENDEKIKNHEKIRRLKSDLKINPNAVTNFSFFGGWQEVQMGKIHYLTEVDLAIGQLTNFDKSKVSSYPEFKVSNSPMDQGKSLCKLGYPFHSIQPTFDGTNFNLPAGSLPVPIFPLEGIFTRKVNVKSNSPTPPAFPLMFIETSSPGLRGQSGGPTVDVNGIIWAIQSQTRHMPLGFGDEKHTGKDAEHLKHQYLNVGWGIHAETITSFLKEKGVSFRSSTL
jgi:hypothetical protein